MRANLIKAIAVLWAEAAAAVPAWPRLAARIRAGVEEALKKAGEKCWQNR